jgi:acetolactate synthase-1/2/3 large subunit
MPDLATAYQHKINLITIVNNDGAFGNVRRIQQARYGSRHIASDLVNPDFVKLADSFNIHARRAEGPTELREALREGMALNAPMVIEYPSPLMPMVRQLTRGKVR